MCICCHTTQYLECSSSTICHSQIPNGAANALRKHCSALIISKMQLHRAMWSKLQASFLAKETKHWTGYTAIFHLNEVQRHRKCNLLVHDCEDCGQYLKEYKMEREERLDCCSECSDSFKTMRVFVWKLHRKAKTEKERDLPPAGSLPRWQQQPGLDQTKGKIQELHPRLPCGWQVPKHPNYLPVLCPSHQQGPGWVLEQPEC